MDDRRGIGVRVRQGGAAIEVEGMLSASEGQSFEARLEAAPIAPGRCTLDLSRLDIEDAAAAVSAVNGVRGLLARTGRLVILGAPQVLGHNLYRVGLLGEGSTVELVDMREDEAYG